MTNISKGKIRRNAYKELIMAILENAPEQDLLALAEEYASSGGSLAEYRSNIQECLARAVKDAKNWIPHYQNGRPVPVLKKSCIGVKLLKGAFSAKDE